MNKPKIDQSVQFKFADYKQEDGVGKGDVEQEIGNGRYTVRLSNTYKTFGKGELITVFEDEIL